MLPLSHGIEENSWKQLYQEGIPKMKRKLLLIISLLIISVLWQGCASQQRTNIQAADVEAHGHTYRYIQSFGKQHYHAALEYDARTGMLEIKFINRDETPLMLLKTRMVKALLVLPGGERREFYFYNFQESGYYFLSYDYSERDSDRLKENDTIFAKQNWLRNLSSFKLTVMKKYFMKQ
jgi:hypothetical protein